MQEPPDPDGSNSGERIPGSPGHGAGGRKAGVEEAISGGGTKERINADSCAVSRRAHLLTTHKWAVVSPSGPCALRGGCGFCGSLMDNATALERCCHCPRRRLYVLLHHQNSCFRFGNNSPSACENLPLAVLSQLWVSLILRHPFSFCKKETKTRTKGR